MLPPSLEISDCTLYSIQMNRTLLKWTILCALGFCFLLGTALCFYQKAYTWIMAFLFIGLFLASTSWKRIRLNKKAAKAIKDGKTEIVIHYKDKNLKESQSSVIPAGADASYFYGFLPERNDVKAFRWERIKRALENGTELNREGILERLAD